MQKINKLYIKKDCAYKRIYTWVEGGGGREKEKERLEICGQYVSGNWKCHRTTD